MGEAGRLMASRSRQGRRGPAQAQVTKDSFQNFAARTGIGTGNVAEQARYGFNPISRKRVDLEYMYRGSWVVGAAVDVVADDMTVAGIDFDAGMEPDDVLALESELERTQAWQSIGDVIRWARLYGGAIGVMMIDGQDLSTPLRLDTVTKGSFRGMLVLDRWSLNPTGGEIIEDLGPDIGKPLRYQVMPNAPALRGRRIHHSRIIRADGVELPYQQRLAEQGWGMSVIERLFDRLLAFDSTTQGAAQLVYKAHLRTYKVKGLRDIIATGGKAFDGLVQQINHIRLWQSNEGMTLMDAEDEFEAHQYTFSGLSDVLLQFGQQISGALQIPLVRLFGQSPAGLNASGDSDLRTYYDGIKRQQEARLRSPLTRIMEVVHRSALGRPPKDGVPFAFRPLWQMSEEQKATIANTTTTAVVGAFEAGIIDRTTALKELKNSAEVTGVFGAITSEDIKAAEDEPPPPPEDVINDPAGPSEEHNVPELLPAAPDA
ncbi:hypothetical protein GCM10019059_32330 [Camelimonas fluminis]|nr:hypothetical protein GCM10019059_32330 [Camelimonas fluminis]